MENRISAFYDEQRREDDVDPVYRRDRARRPGLFVRADRQRRPGGEARPREAEAQAGQGIGDHHAPVVGGEGHPEAADGGQAHPPAQQPAGRHAEHPDQPPLGQEAGDGAHHHRHLDVVERLHRIEPDLVDDQKAQDAVKFVARRKNVNLGVYLISYVDWQATLRKYSPYRTEIARAVQSINTKSMPGGQKSTNLEDMENGEEAPIVKIVAVPDKLVNIVVR